jgi:hypothetical protein
MLAKCLHDAAQLEFFDLCFLWGGKSPRRLAVAELLRELLENLVDEISPQKSPFRALSLRADFPPAIPEPKATGQSHRPSPVIRRSESRSKVA